MPSSRPPRKVFDIEGHAHFVSFSCYHHLKLLSRDRCKQIVLGQMNLWSGRWGVGIVGYVIMPDHVHTLLRPVEEGCLIPFIKEWKNHSSTAIQQFLELGTPGEDTPFGDRVRDRAGNIHVWQKSSHCFNVFTPAKALQKLVYMHNNPVRAELVATPELWPWSSAAHFLLGKRSPVRLVPYDGPLPQWLHDGLRAGNSLRAKMIKHEN